MIDLLILLVVNSFVCYGFWNASNYAPARSVIKQEGDRIVEKIEPEEKGVLWFIEKWSADKWFHKPLCGCLPCMASFHSTYVYWGYMHSTNSLNLNAVIFYPVYILALSGLNSYLYD